MAGNGTAGICSDVCKKVCGNTGVQTFEVNSDQTVIYPHKKCQKHLRQNIGKRSAGEKIDAVQKGKDK